MKPPSLNHIVLKAQYFTVLNFSLSKSRARAKLKLLTFGEEELIKRFIEKRIKFSELEDLWRKYNGPLIKCLDQFVGTKLRREIVDSRCPIEKFHKTLEDIIFKENIPSKGYYKFNEAQLLALEGILNDFECGFECPCCPASILDKVSS